jgi:hypothetical protein
MSYVVNLDGSISCETAEEAIAIRGSLSGSQGPPRQRAAKPAQLRSHKVKADAKRLGRPPGSRSTKPKPLSAQGIAAQKDWDFTYAHIAAHPELAGMSKMAVRSMLQTQGMLPSAQNKKK